ncbi:hypothetical protein SADUNF_Sadunf03G0127600 [Salix dunnii]|uniref:Uncharacterized protein n=1 Tax=Salix dunnii TaxID=1413687 RepID=A0A835N4K2_9ROSI|nr:hypothetical protein SADUNF_Sadunf03G0127600 [Salix dunnii]
MRGGRRKREERLSQCIVVSPGERENRNGEEEKFRKFGCLEAFGKQEIIDNAKKDGVIDEDLLRILKVCGVDLLLATETDWSLGDCWLRVWLIVSIDGRA